MLLEDKSDKTFAEKLDAILDAQPKFAKGVEAVRKEGEKPKPARSGSAADEPLKLSEYV
jgi:hypothetical protein